MNNVALKEGMTMTKYHYIECGLDNVYLVNGVKITKHKDGSETVRIHDILGLHRAIALGIVSKPGRLMGREARFLRHILDLSQKKLAELLGISNYQTVLNWEKDIRPITKPNDRFLRMLVYLYYDEDSKIIYDKINELSDIDAAGIEKERLTFKLTDIDGVKTKNIKHTEDHTKWIEAVAA